MSYSKLRQEKVYQETINYHKIQCPICKKKGQYHKNLETGDIECECGLILHTNHKYVAGQKINTNISKKHTVWRYKNGKYKQ